MTRVTVGSCESRTQLPDPRYDLGSREDAAAAIVRRAVGAVVAFCTVYRHPRQLPTSWRRRVADVGSVSGTSLQQPGRGRD